jgi:hypothetical protein
LVEGNDPKIITVNKADLVTIGRDSWIFEETGAYSEYPGDAEDQAEAQDELT